MFVVFDWMNNTFSGLLIIPSFCWQIFRESGFGFAFGDTQPMMQIEINGPEAGYEKSWWNFLLFVAVQYSWIKCKCSFYKTVKTRHD